RPRYAQQGARARSELRRSGCPNRALWALEFAPWAHWATTPAVRRGARRGGARSPADLRKWFAGFGKQEALQQITPDLEESVAFVHRFHPVGNHVHSHVPAQIGHRANDLLLRWVQVYFPGQ